MKIAIPTKNNQVDDHFGHCEAYSVFTINSNQEIESIEMLPSPEGCGCKSNIASVLREKGVTVLLAGNMGTAALELLNNHGIKVFRGSAGDVRKLTEAYLQGQIKDSGIGCTSHEQHHGEGSDGHVCSSNHENNNNKGYTLA